MSTRTVLPRLWAFFIASSTLGMTTAAAESPRTAKRSALPHVVSLVAAENEFAAHSVATDMREAFIRALGEDGLLLRPTPVPGGAFMAARPAPNIELNWRPTFAMTSRAGDFGVTYGPWRIRSKANASAPPLFGHFISLWKRRADGRWQVAFDTGISHAQATGSDAFLEVVASPSQTRPTPSAAQVDAVMDAFIKRVASSDYNTAVREFAATDARVFREGSDPFLNGAQRMTLKPRWSQHQLKTSPIASGEAESSDLVWRLFEIRSPAPESALVSHGFNVWRIGASGALELLIDVTTDMPALAPTR